jgi:hypothetical protein
MVDIPSIFNVNQFFETLLPGYLAVILFLFLFYPDFLSSNRSVGFSLDFLSAIIFLVAGPVIGVVLRQLQSCFFYFKKSLSASGALASQSLLHRHYFLRLSMTEDEKKELATMEAQHTFSISSSIVIFIITTIHLIKVTINGEEILWLIDIPLLIVGVIFVLGGHVLMSQGISPLYSVLYLKYNIK